MRKVSKKVSRRRGQLGSAIAQALEGRLLMSTTWTVTSTADDGGTGTLRYAVNNSASGDTITFDSTVFASPALHTITLAGSQLEINHNVALTGPGAGNLKIDGNNASRILKLDSGVTVSLSGIDIANGHETEGGGIYNNGATLHLTNVNFDSNSAVLDGGGIYSDANGTLTVDHSAFTNNSSAGIGALGGKGGAIESTGGATLTITSSSFTSNKVGTGNTSNSSDASGGALYSDGTLKISASAFISNSIAVNTTTYGGGVIYSAGALSVDDSQFSQNSANTSAAVIYTGLSSTATITNSTFDHNHEGTPSIVGGGPGAIACAGTMTVGNCTFNANVGALGGALFSYFGGVTVYNSTFFANTSVATVGALYLNGIDTVTNCTVVGNSGLNAGGIYATNGPSTINNTIVAQNTTNTASAPSDVAGPSPVTGSNNLIGEGGGNGLTSGVNGNTVGISDPLLSALGSFGGDTQTMLPLSGSAAIDAGSDALAVDANNAVLTTDQRGLARISNSKVDIGAVELQNAALTAPVISPVGGISPTFNWALVPGATSYNIYRGLTSGSETLLASGVTANEYVDSSAVPRTVYYYKVSATNGSTVGPRSNELPLSAFYSGSILYVNQIGHLGLNEGTAYSNLLFGQFPDSSPSPLTTAAATINWGDGTSSAATIDSTGSIYEIRGSHTWKTAGDFTLTIHLTDTAGNADITLTQKQTVLDVPLTAVSKTVNATATQSFSGVVGSFSDGAGTTDPSNYSVLILWGDTDFSIGTVHYNAQTSQFDVSGSHTYAAAGNYTLRSAVSDLGGSYVNVDSTAKVSASTVSLVPVPAHPVANAGVLFNGVVGSFFSFPATNSPSIYSATVNWGDGHSSAGTITFNSSTNEFDVKGSNTYFIDDYYPVSIAVIGTNNSSTQISSSMQVDSPLDAPGLTANAGTKGIVLNWSTVAGATSYNLYRNTVADNQSHTPYVSGLTGNTYTDTNGVAGTRYEYVIRAVKGNVVGPHSNEPSAVMPGVATSVLAATGANFAAIKSISVTPLLATFTDSHTGQAASHYTASINWGDATTSAGVIALVNGKFQVTGTHSYNAAGTFTATVTITDPEGGSAAPKSTATVSNPVVTPTSVLSATGTTFTATKGVSVTPLLATFTDTHTGQSASHYTATISWGDATTSAGVIALVSGKFQVTGTHTYAAAGSFSATIKITDPEGGSATATSKATVSNPVVIPPGSSVLKGTAVSTSATKGLAFSGLLLATFSDTTPNQAAGYYTTSINWGDGSSSAGVVTYNATTKLFQVAGAHTYHKAATFAPVISISDKAGGNTSVTSKLYVADSVMHAFPTTITASAGKAFTGVVGSFTDGDPSDVPSDFVATINWGNGHTSAGTVSLNPTTKRFDITGTNIYAAGGTFNIIATPSDVGGMNIAIKSTAIVTVASGPLVKLTGSTSDKEGSSEAISFSATDAGNKAISKWVVDWGDGVSQTLAGNATSASHTYVDGPSTRTVKATATDAANLSASATLTVGVLNVAPTATFTGGSSVQPNHTSTATFSNVKDPSTTDTSAGFHYSFDFNNDGKFEIVNGTSLTATVPATYLATIGTKTIHGRVTDKDGGSTDYYTTINVISQPLTSFGTSIKAVEGTKFTGNIGSFADPSGNTNPAIYTAAITWGDGHTSTGTVAYNASTKRFGVSGTNTYALIGNFAITIAVKSSAGAAGTIQSSASISDAAIAATGSAISGKEGVSVLGVVATFTDANPLAIAGNYVTSINWGDGSAASAGTVSFNSSTKRWQVMGSHTYRSGGTYTLTTSISDHGTSSAKATSSAIIAGSTIKVTGVKLTVMNSTLASTPQKVASFTTSNPLLTASNFSASIDWGDGTTSNPSSSIAIVYDATNKVFNVMVTHPYSLLLKNYTATITVTEGKGASSATATSTIFTN